MRRREDRDGGGLLELFKVVAFDAAILHPDRAVDAQLLHDRGLVGFADVAARREQDVDDVAGSQTQQEEDELWEKLTEGGEEVDCGWLRDKYGLSWQIVPTILGKLMQDKDPEKVRRVTEELAKL